MTTLFDRSVRLVAGTLDLSALDVAFSVKKNLKPEPNVAEIKVWNLSESSRKTLEAPGVLSVELHAGYGTDLSLLYRGEVRSAYSTVDGPDIVTVLSSGDKEASFRGKRLHVPVGPGLGAEAALDLLADALGVGRGNTPTALATLAARGEAPLFPFGGVLSGNVANELTSLCRSVGLEWSIQDGTLQILDKNKALEDIAIELAADTGLIGSPSIDNKGIVTATSLLIPDLRPGRKVTFRTKTEFQGGYRIQDVEYTGDKAGSEWFAKIEAKRV